jgi:TetR/AcrR family transcriptional regulator, copper-responsive repressor
MHRSVHFAHNRDMARPKNFTRDGVLANALPVFWQHGFADTSLQALEQATGVNRSGLYAEFEDKEDLFVQSLQYYLDAQTKRGLLTREPLGWKNIEQFLKLGPFLIDGQKGCFSVSSIREFPILPPKAVEMVTQSFTNLKRTIARNIEAEESRMNANELADVVLTFFTGLSMEQNLNASRASVTRKVDNFMVMVRQMGKR